MKTQGSAVKLVLIVLLVLVMPVSGVQAESANELRKRALQRISKLLTRPVATFSMRRMRAKLKNHAANGPIREGKITLEPIECSSGAVRSPVFKVRIESKNGEKASIVSITFPVGYITMPVGWNVSMPWPKGIPSYDEIGPEREIKVSVKPVKGGGLDDLTPGEGYRWKYVSQGDSSDRTKENEHGMAVFVSRAVDFQSARDPRNKVNEESIALPIDDEIVTNLRKICQARNKNSLTALTDVRTPAEYCTT